ncbi:unnamed protein product [Ixodes pacificus]
MSVEDSVGSFVFCFYDRPPARKKIAWESGILFGFGGRKVPGGDVWSPPPLSTYYVK